MPGDRWQQLANLRSLYAFMWAHPGKQLLFMGSEFGQESEWSEARSLDWWLLDLPDHRGVLFSMKNATESWDHGRIVVQTPDGQLHTVMTEAADGRGLIVIGTDFAVDYVALADGARRALGRFSEPLNGVLALLATD